MNSIRCEMKKSLYPPLFILSCIGVILACAVCEGYTSGSRTTYTILELFLFVGKDVLLTDVSLNRYEIWEHGLGMWVQIFLPLLLSIGYLYTISAEKQTGYERLLLLRENNRRYSISKLAAAMFSGGLILLTGYILFGVLIWMKFPSLYEYSPDQIQSYLALVPGFAEPLFCLRKCISVFLYGMCLNVFAYLVSIFFTDKYILICLPLLLRYVWEQIVLKLQLRALEQGSATGSRLCSGLRIETILTINYPGGWWGPLIVITLLYLSGFGISVYLLKKKGEGFGFE